MISCFVGISNSVISSSWEKSSPRTGLVSFDIISGDSDLISCISSLFVEISDLFVGVSDLGLSICLCIFFLMTVDSIQSVLGSISYSPVAIRLVTVFRIDLGTIWASILWEIVVVRSNFQVVLSCCILNSTSFFHLILGICLLKNKGLYSVTC